LMDIVKRRYWNQTNSMSGKYQSVRHLSDTDSNCVWIVSLREMRKSCKCLRLSSSTFVSSYPNGYAFLGLSYAAI
jgi:hypothetical protein